MEENNCPLCNKPLAAIGSGDGNWLDITCPCSGWFRIQRGLRARFTDDAQRGNACGYVKDNRGIRIDQDQMEKLRFLRPLSVMEKAARMLKHFAELAPIPGQSLRFIRTDAAVASAWLADGKEYMWMLKHMLMEELRWIDGVLPLGTISPRGWVALEEMKKPSSDPAKCFVAMWFKDLVKPVFTDAILPAARDAGYEAERVDMIQHNHQITDEIIAGVRRGKFLIADFTGHRGGVYFEAGFALGLGKQVIWLVRHDHLRRLHFDNRQYNFIPWTPNKLDDLRAQLRLRIEATQGRGPL